MRFVFLGVILFSCLQSNLCAYFSEKFYVHPEDIRLTKEGIYFIRDGQNVPVQSVHTDSSGIFAVFDNNNDVRYTSYTCPGCGRTYYWWQNCNTPGCPENRPH